MLTWKSHRQEIIKPLLNFCKSHNIPVINNHSFKNVPSSTRNVVYLKIGDLIENFESWQQFNEVCIVQQKVVFVVTDNFYKFQNFSNIYFFAFTEMNGVFADEQSSIQIIPKSKLYNCFINRVDSVRQSWFYFLYHYNLLDQGYVSLLLNNLDSYSECKGKELFEYNHQKYKLNNLPIFETAYQNLKDLVPYQNFLETSDLVSYTAKSKYSLVLETCAVEDGLNQWHISEKSMRALQNPTIPLLFLQAQGLNLLKSLGFEFHTDYFYIDDMSWQERQSELLKMLANDFAEYNENKAIDICQHNRQILNKMLLCAKQKDYFDNLFNCILTN